MKSPSTVVAGVALLLCLTAAQESNATARFFLGIGASDGHAGEESLRWAATDVEKMEAVFVELGGVHPSRSVTLENPTVRDVRDAFLRLQGNVEELNRQGERAELVIHFAGHGDANTLHLRGESMKIEDLQRYIRTVPAAAAVVVIDACRTKARTRGGVIGPAFDGTVIRTPTPDGVVVMFASKDGEVAQESDAIEGAFFTHALTTALRGGADLNQDGQVSLAEAWQVAHSKTLTKTHAIARTQHPQLSIALEGEGELILTELSRARATVELGHTIIGHVLILDARTGRVLIETDKRKATAVRLAVPPTRIGVQVRPVDGDARRGEFSLEWGGAARVNWADLEEAKPIASVSRGEGDVDATPWETSVFTGLSLSPQLFPGATIGASVQRRVFGWPLFIGISAEGSGSFQEHHRWVFHHGVARSALTTRLQGHISVIRLHAGIDASVIVVGQHGRRLDSQRVQSATGSSDDLVTGALGFGGGAVAGASVPLLGGFFASAEAGLGLQFLNIQADEASAIRPQVRGDVRVGLGFEF